MRTRRFAGLAVLVAALWVVSTVAASAATAATGSISGHVTGSAGQPLAGASVLAINAANQANVAPTAGDGSYTIPSLPDGSYTVSFSFAGYALQYYDAATTSAAAKPVTITGGAAVSGIDARLQQTDSISGTVTDASGTPIEGINVAASNATDPGSIAQTAADGTYTINNLLPGTYSVRFTPFPQTAGFNPGGGNYLPQYYNGEPSSQHADPVNVTGAATTSGIDAHLQAGGEISGHVVDQSGAPVANVLVSAYNALGAKIGSWFTDAGGQYLIDQLPGGTYALGFQVQTPNGSNLVAQYFPGRTTLAGASGVAVAQGADVMIDAHLNVPATGTVTGTVTDPNGHAVSGATVSIDDSAEGFSGQAGTGSDGTYTASGLPAGTYDVEFESPAGQVTAFSSGGGAFLHSFFDGKDSFADADPVSVSAGATTAAINGVLPFAGELAGRVTTPGGAGLANVSVRAYDANGNVVQYTVTAPDGTYTIGGLQSGSYRVQFAPLSGNPITTTAGNYAPQFYGGATALSGALPVAVTQGATADGVDAQLQPGATITGTVTGPTGASLAGAQISAYDASGTLLEQTSTGADGSYTLTDLGGASYEVGFMGLASGSNAVNVAPQYYPGAADLAGATAVTVPAGGTVGAINAQMAAGGAITGNVTDTSGGPINGEVEISVLDSQGRYVGSAIVLGTTSNPSGSYSVGALAGGQYTIQFAALQPDVYATQYYSKETTADTATRQSDIEGATTAGVNARFAQLPGSIAGTVTDGSGNPVAGTVTFYDSNGQPAGSVQTAADGTYAASGLAPGFDRVYFTADGYDSTFYGGASTLNAATSILVSSSQTAAGIGTALTATNAGGPPTSSSSTTTANSSSDGSTSQPPAPTSTSTATTATSTSVTATGSDNSDDRHHAPRRRLVTPRRERPRRRPA